MGFIKRHRLLLAILSFVLMGLPQSIEAIWSLAERISGANIVMPKISIAWFSWITIPIGLIMLAIIVWQVKRSKQPVEETLTLKKDEQLNRLRIEVQSASTTLAAMSLVEVMVKFSPIGEVELHSLKLYIRNLIYDAENLPVKILDQEATYTIGFEVPYKVILNQKKSDTIYIGAIYNDRDCRSNDFPISIVSELADNKPSDVIVPKRPSPELVIEIDNFTFGFGGGGYPPKRFDGDNALWLRLGVTFKMNQTMRIETLYLLLSGESIQPHGESGYYFYFEMPQWAKPDEVRTIQLVAFAKGTKWGSEEKEIRITSPPQ